MNGKFEKSQFLSNFRLYILGGLSMDQVLYDLMDWAGIEEIVYSEAANPERLLGAHEVEEGLLIQVFMPHAVAVAAKVGNESYPMELQDEAGYYAVLLHGKKMSKYLLEITYDNGTTEELQDPYAFPSQFTDAELKKFDAGIYYVYWSTASKILYFILACIILTFFIRFLLRRTEKKHTAEINQLNLNKEKEVHEAKIKFFTMIAHEIRTPVSLIIGPLEKMMRSSIPIPAALRDDLNIIDRNSQRLLFLVNQLLDFRKVEQEGISIRYASYNIRQLLQAVCERFTPFITQHGAHLEIEYPDADFTAMVDSEAITKLISNLLTNASKYTKDKVVLSCTVQPEQHTFTIRVTDNGIGISEADRKKIFNPFYQAMDNKPGTGIGLSIVKSIVESHNGCIEVESEINKGSSFIVTLPIEQVNAAAQEGESNVLNPAIPEDILLESLPVASSKDKPMMLIVDDNEEMLNFLSSSFSARYSILTAEDGIEALEKLKTNEVTLIVSDWMMPRMDGVEFCKTLRADQAISHIPFILLTAKTDTNSKIEGMDCGADAYIEKPFSVQYLEACIKNLLDLRSLLRQKFSKMPMVPLNSIASNSMDNKFLTRVNEIIEQNFSNSDLSVDFLAEQLCISRSGLFAKIKTLANITPNELIQIVRLKKAAVLLSENKYRVNEICYMVGFNNPSYFAKCFQKQFGIKPGEFANNPGASLLQ